LNLRNLLIALIWAGLLAGCATAYPPAPRPAPTPPATPPAEFPQDRIPLPDALPDQAPMPEPEPAPTVRTPVDAERPTLALLRQSERSADSGDVEGAIAYVERAIRLDSRDAELWLRLARLQLTANRPTIAEQLAHKAIALSRQQRDHERQGWLLVADAREAQGDRDGATQIRDRWRTYRG